MKNMFNGFVVVGLLVGMVASSSAATRAETATPEFFASAELASAYVFRGVTYNDGMVIQPAIEGSGFGLPQSWGLLSAGVWANYNIDEYYSVPSDSISEVDLYAFYSIPLDGLELSVGYIRYAYPNQTNATTSAAQQDDSEAVFKMAFTMEDALELAGGLYYGLDGAVKKNFYYDLSAVYTMPMSDAFGLTIGAETAYLDPQIGEKGWSHAVADLGLKYTLNTYWELGASVVYVYQMDDGVLGNADAKVQGYGYDVDLLYKLLVSCRF